MNKNPRILMLLVLLAPKLAQADSQWVLEQSTLTYHVSHMLQATRGAQFPMVSVRTQLPEAASASATIHADLEIQFAGQTAQYKQVAFQVVKQGNQIRISGIIPATLSDFKIDPPSLLATPVKNEMPVRVEMPW